MRRVADFVVDLVQATDAQTDRPGYVEIKKVATIGPSDGDASDRPYFGSMPAYPNPEKDGVLLERIAENSPAAKAGLKDGDVLLSVGGHRTASLEDFQAALTNFKPGDKVRIKARRGQEAVEGETVLTRRGMP
jgi:S1-C subfamily serine protease